MMSNNISKSFSFHDLLPSWFLPQEEQVASQDQTPLLPKASKNSENFIEEMNNLLVNVNYWTAMSGINTHCSDSMNQRDDAYYKLFQKIDTLIQEKKENLLEGYVTSKEFVALSQSNYCLKTDNGKTIYHYRGLAGKGWTPSLIFFAEALCLFRMRVDYLKQKNFEKGFSIAKRELNLLGQQLYFDFAQIWEEKEIFAISMLYIPVEEKFSSDQLQAFIKGFYSLFTDFVSDPEIQKKGVELLTREFKIKKENNSQLVENIQYLFVLYSDFLVTKQMVTGLSFLIDQVGGSDSTFLTSQKEVFHELCSEKARQIMEFVCLELLDQLPEKRKPAFLDFVEYLQTTAKSL